MGLCLLGLGLKLLLCLREQCRWALFGVSQGLGLGLDTWTDCDWLCKAGWYALDLWLLRLTRCLVLGLILGWAWQVWLGLGLGWARISASLGLQVSGPGWAWA